MINPPILGNFHAIKTLTINSPSGWWLPSGLTANDCVAAYQPVGAQTLEDSYINLAHPGTNNIVSTGTAPQLVLEGWKALAFASTILDTGIIPSDYDWSVITIFSLSSQYSAPLMAPYAAPFGILLQQNNASGKCYAGSTTSLYDFYRSAYMRYCIAISDRMAYDDGILSSSQGDGVDIPVSSLKYFGGFSLLQSHTVSASAIYNKPITVEQIIAIKDAMYAMLPQ